MQIPLFLSSFLLSSTIVTSSLIGSAIAKPIAAKRDAGASTGSNPAPTPHTASANNEALIGQLVTAGTAVDRYKLLQPEDFGYDFKNPPEGAVTMGQGGHTVKADRKTFPALIGHGVSMTIGFIGPCGFNTPHVHPRSAEFNVVVQGQLHSEFIAENGATPILHNATEFQAVIFPQGAVHTEFNPTCQQSIFVAGFGNEDPGVQQSAQTFFGLDPSIIKAALGGDAFLNGQDVDSFKTIIPANVALGVEQCLQTCGIRKRDSIPGA